MRPTTLRIGAGQPIHTHGGSWQGFKACIARHLGPDLPNTVSGGASLLRGALDGRQWAIRITRNFTAHFPLGAATRIDGFLGLHPQLVLRRTLERGRTSALSRGRLALPRSFALRRYPRGVRSANAYDQLANSLKSLDAAMRSLHEGLGAAWRDTVVVVLTKFGRTVAVNGTRGTDQLKPTTSLHALMKGVLRDHLQLTEAALENLFPAGTHGRPVAGLVRERR